MYYLFLYSEHQQIWAALKMFAKLYIITTPYKNVSIELRFNAIPFGELRNEKHLLDIFGQRFNIIQKNFISIQVFLIFLVCFLLLF